MDATRAVPNWPPVVATMGLAGAVTTLGPDAVPLAPRLVNDARVRRSLLARGVLQVQARNRAGLAALRSHKRMRMMPAPKLARPQRKNLLTEAVHLRRRCRAFVPTDLLLAHIKENFRADKEPTHIPKWQGNAVAGARTAAGDHVVFFPGGEVLQQARALVQVFGADARSFTSLGVETGTTIRQFAVMGEAFAQTSDELLVAARGAANCSILKAPPLHADAATPMKAKFKLTFAEMLYHVAASPHVEAELAFVTGDGLIHWWEPESGVQTVNIETGMASERLLRCEYSSHPCVLWAANRFTVRSMDLRERAKPLLQYDKIFDLASVGSPLAAIYDVKRRSGCPFQLVVGSSVSIEVMDCRMPMQPLLSWAQQGSAESEQTEFGMIQEVDLAASSNETQGAIISTSRRNKVATVYPFELSARAEKNTVLSLSSLRNLDDNDADIRSAHTSQFVVSDAPLDLPLVDGGEWTELVGVCALPLPCYSEPKRESAATVYLMNDLGDLFSQEICSRRRNSSYDAAVQLELPVGVTAEPSSDGHKKNLLPLDVDAILPEHDTASLTPFVPLAMKLLRHKYPQLPRDRMGKEGEPEPTIDAERLVTELLSVCRPSATLFRLHRFVNDELKFPIASSDLALFLRSRREFDVRNVHRAHRQPVAQVLVPNGVQERPIHERDGDPRLAVCACCPESAEAPCESFSCVVPHALVVSGAEGLRLHEIFPRRASQSSSEFAEIIAEARELYGAD